ncbi:hypothetical protein K402DRAFT_160869 [Aulographum hederae CBS 113979]|uniref:Uncharacterized protein n=1 Tax=Aulographum hederae CBS 113979 TaxID=1176131 RepID=A0A6G1GRY4_9PEZI|nr:hypothetical protein K402DRAFT_160869 [Aulographum hederae CBS 113979]
MSKFLGRSKSLRLRTAHKVAREHDVESEIFSWASSSRNMQAAGSVATAASKAPRGQGQPHASISRPDITASSSATPPRPSTATDVSLSLSLRSRRDAIETFATPKISAAAATVRSSADDLGLDVFQSHSRTDNITAASAVAVTPPSEHTFLFEVTPPVGVALGSPTDIIALNIGPPPAPTRREKQVPSQIDELVDHKTTNNNIADRPLPVRVDSLYRRADFVPDVDTMERTGRQKKPSRWRSLFGRKPAQDTPPTSVSSAEDSSIHALSYERPPWTPEEQQKPRYYRTDSKSRGVPLTPFPDGTPPPSGGKKEDRMPKHFPMMVERGWEVTPGKQKSSGMLDVEIPSVKMERYSVMFGNVLGSNVHQPPARKQSLLERRRLDTDRVKPLSNKSLKTPDANKPQRRATSPSYRSPSFSLFPRTETTEPHSAHSTKIGPKPPAVHRPRPIQRSQTAPQPSPVRAYAPSLPHQAEITPGVASSNYSVDDGNDVGSGNHMELPIMLHRDMLKAPVVEMEKQEPAWEMVTKAEGRSTEKSNVNANTNLNANTNRTTSIDAKIAPAGGDGMNFSLPSFHHAHNLSVVAEAEEHVPSASKHQDIPLTPTKARKDTMTSDTTDLVFFPNAAAAVSSVDIDIPVSVSDSPEKGQEQQPPQIGLARSMSLTKARGRAVSKPVLVNGIASTGNAPRPGSRAGSTHSASSSRSGTASSVKSPTIIEEGVKEWERERASTPPDVKKPAKELGNALLTPGELERLVDCRKPRTPELVQMQMGARKSQRVEIESA